MRLTRTIITFLICVLLLQNGSAQTSIDSFMTAIEGPQAGATGEL